MLNDLKNNKQKARDPGVADGALPRLRKWLKTLGAAAMLAMNSTPSSAACSCWSWAPKGGLADDRGGGRYSADRTTVDWGLRSSRSSRTHASGSGETVG